MIARRSLASEAGEGPKQELLTLLQLLQPEPSLQPKQSDRREKTPDTETSPGQANLADRSNWDCEKGAVPEAKTSLTRSPEAFPEPFPLIKVWH